MNYTNDRAGNTPLAYTIRDAVKVSGIGRTTIFRLLALGRLKATKIGRRTLIQADSLRTLIAEGG